MEKHYKRSNRFIGRGIKMLDIREELELNELFRIVKENKLKYEVITSKSSNYGEITYLEIRFAGKDNE